MCLNINQNNIVKYIKGPCLVLAGAGSGKTRVIVNKIVYLIDKENIESKNILAITFTNKSAEDMRIQLSKKLNNYDLKNLIVTTFHSFGLKIIKTEISLLHLDSNFSLFDQEEKNTLLKQITKKIFNNNNLLFKLNFKISEWKNKLINPSLAKLHAHTLLEKMFADCYVLYQIYLNNCNKLDLDDLIFIPTILLKENVSVRSRWQKKIRYLLVDEYQDTNISQYNFIKMLNPKNFTLVGDDDQSIYSWRGAEPKNLLYLQTDYPNLKIFKLEKNYRSSGRILNVANKLISNNIHLFQKKLVSQLSYGIKIKIVEGNDEKDEAEKIVNNILIHQKTYHTKYNDYAILYRGNFQAKVFESILIKNKIPYNIKNQIHILKSFEVKIIFYYLKFIVNPNDDFYFTKIINKPNRKIGNITLLKLKKYAKINKISLFQVCLNCKLLNTLNKNKLQSIENFVNIINESTILLQKEPKKLIYFIFKKINYKYWLQKTLKKINKYKLILNQINTLSNIIIDLLTEKTKYSTMNFSEVLSHMTLYMDYEFSHTKLEESGINLMTLHGSKGLEFSFVFIIGLEEGLIPHHSSLLTNNIEEERRLVYVGITRAKKELFLTFSKQRNYNGLIYRSKPSRFLFELPQEDLVWLSMRKKLDASILINNSITKIHLLRKSMQLKNKK